MENCKSVDTALNNIAVLNLAGAIDKGQWETVLKDYFLHTSAWTGQNKLQTKTEMTQDDFY